MKWFRHMANFSSSDPRGSEVLEILGVEGYGRFFLLMELMASQMDHDTSKPIIKSTLKSLARKLRTNEKGLITFLEILVALDIINLSCSQEVREKFQESISKEIETLPEDIELKKNRIVLRCDYVREVADKNSISSTKRRATGKPKVETEERRKENNTMIVDHTGKEVNFRAEDIPF